MLVATRPPTAPANSIVISYGACIDDNDLAHRFGEKVFSVLLIEEADPDIVLWRGRSYDEAIRQSEYWLAAHLPFRPELAGWGIIDMVGRAGTC